MFPTVFSGCTLSELLHRGENTVVFRGKRGPDGDSLIVKLLEEENPGRERLRTISREFEILKSLDGVDGVARAIGLEHDGGRWGLLLADGGSSSLRSLGIAGALSSEQLLALAVEAASILDRIHERGVIHKDVNPSNLVLDRATGRLQLIDFGIATVLREEPLSHASHPEAEGTLAYMSPEQTGRTNRALDYRTDYYSLGATLYELATGQPPFQSEDPLELIHAHVARPVRPAVELRQELPQVLSSIITKLLAKDADLRYQTARGLRADLQRCLEALRAGHADPQFELGTDDRSSSFRLSSRLHGRERELGTLTAALDHTCAGGATFVAVHGPAGIGKSALVQELHRPLAGRQGYFLSGKFEPGALNAPYLGIRQALAAFVANVLLESNDRIAEWRSRILAHVPNVQLLIDACPTLELLLGAQSPLHDLPAEDARIRLHHAFHDLFATLTAAGRPICLFLDDVQWAGPDSVELIQEILRAGARHSLLLICAYRDGDPEEAPSMDAELGVKGFEEAGIRVERLVVPPLGPAALASVIRDSLPSADAQASALAEIVFARTAGNPFFARAFLESLHAGGLLVRKPAGGGIDLDLIAKQTATENVVALLVRRIAALPDPTREMLLAAACLGARFDLATIRRSMPYLAGRALWPAIEAGLVFPLDRFHATSELDGDEPLQFCFAHDRVQQAVRATADDHRRREVHLVLGRSLRRHPPAGPRAAWLFDVVGQLNEARDLIGTSEERLELAGLNLEAARTALATAAGRRALDLALIGRGLLGAEGWSASYELALELGLAAAEGAFIAGDWEHLGSLTAEVLGRVRSPLDAVRALRLQGQVHYSQHRPAEAIGDYLKALKELGVSLSGEATPADVEREMTAVSDALAGRSPEALADLAPCSDARAALAMEILSKLVFATLIVNSQLQSVVVCRLVCLSLAHGNVAESANGYIFYGLLLTFRQDITQAVRFARLAIAVSERFKDPAVLAQTYLYANYQLLHWTTPMADLVPPLLRAHGFALEAGAPFLAACSATTYCIGRLLSGEALAPLGADMERLRGYVTQSRQTLVLNWHEVYQQAVENLRIDSPDPVALCGPVYDERTRLDEHVRTQDFSAQFNYHFARMHLGLLFGDATAALASADATQALSFFASAFWAAPLTFLDSLCRMLALDQQPERREKLLAQIGDNQKKLLAWLPHNPLALEHKVALIEAELARVQGESVRAEQGYVRAAELAHNSGPLQEEGIVCERAARFFISSGDVSRARGYLRRAQRAYSRWGADAKVKRLEREFPHLVSRAIPGSVTVANLARGRDQDFDIVDFVSVLNGSRAISSEIRSDLLLQKLLRIVIECGGAQAAYVLMLTDGRWVVEAGRRMDSTDATTVESIAIDDLASKGHQSLPISVINYAARTRECVLLDDAAASVRFGHDPYIADTGLKSILCLPLLRQRELLGVVYLENALVRGAFSANSVIVLEVLAAQAVISLENARLYNRLEQQVLARTQELSERNRDLAAALSRQEEMQKQLVTQEKLAGLGALTAGIAHEIKNPLNFVTNFGQVSLQLTEEIAQQLRPGAKLDLQREGGELRNLLLNLRQSTNKVVEHGRRASEIVAAMASHGGPGTGRLETIDLNVLVASSVKLTAIQSQDGLKVEIKTDYDPDAGEVEAVAQDINRVLVNLINNARQALLRKKREDGEAFVPELHVATRAMQNAVQIAIRDNGVGIPESLQEKIFAPFFTTKPAGEGTGLGLSISHDIVTRLHQGKLQVRSVEGAFAEFVVTLPRKSLGATHG
jgi:histidine kinase